ncbi:unnamed protein product [Linum trigynum]|uniref:Uncharacterized protein n=1 Tax=Linum trigynum TaxID=586398 RepID=A0AAV2DYM1_9ROSI
MTFVNVFLRAASTVLSGEGEALVLVRGSIEQVQVAVEEVEEEQKEEESGVEVEVAVMEDNGRRRRKRGEVRGDVVVWWRQDRRCLATRWVFKGGRGSEGGKG